MKIQGRNHGIFIGKAVSPIDLSTNQICRKTNFPPGEFIKVKSLITQVFFLKNPYYGKLGGL